MFVNKDFINTGAYMSKNKCCYNAKPSPCYFYMKKKITLIFRICISVPLNPFGSLVKSFLPAKKFKFCP